jgi:hypothetical protein
MVELVACPDPNCQVAADIVDRFVLASTHGPVQHARTMCLNGHTHTPLADDLTSLTGRPGSRDTRRSLLY